LTSTLLAVLAQRLVRRLCPVCAGTGLSPAGTEAAASFAAPTTSGLARCEKCFGTGYFGRLGVFEIMRVTDDLRRVTVQGSDAVSLAETARAGGMRTMMDDAMDKVRLGLTTESEVNRLLR